jgi:hypothetical protein
MTAVLTAALAVGVLTGCGSPAAEPAPAVTAAAAPSASAEPSIPTGAPYRDTKGGFGIVPPAGWVNTPLQPGDDSSVAFKSPEPDQSGKSPIYPYLLVRADPISLPNLDSFVVANKKDLGTSLTGFKIEVDRRLTLPDGHEAHLLSGGFDDSDVGRVRGTQLFELDGKGHVYTVNVTTTDPGFPTYADQIQQTLMSFTLL